jgi:hypothetical protein
MFTQACFIHASSAWFSLGQSNCKGHAQAAQHVSSAPQPHHSQDLEAFSLKHPSMSPNASRPTCQFHPGLTLEANKSEM